TIGGSKKHRVGNFVQRGLLSMNLYDALNAYTMIAVGYLWPTFVVVRCVSLRRQHSAAVFTVSRFGTYRLGLFASQLVSACFQYSRRLYLGGLNIHRDTWSGWSTRAFMDWGKFLYTVMPCLLTQSLWYLGTEYGNFLAGLIGKAEIAAESVLFQLNVIAFLIPVGIGSALISRIGYYLSTQQPEKLVRLVLTSLAFMGTMGAHSRIRACNSHLHTLLMNVIGYYVIGAPLGISLAFAAGWGLNGLWVGFATSSVSFFILLAICALRLDWPRSSHCRPLQRRDGDRQWS
uniref:Polysacc_synt_C domain-containing protein n=1 Tax=Macrostomum lignano TaxID=282301 RepID=A0A1I8F3Q1_9PLAT